jgi:vancomycin resistance protein YoaR
MRTLHYPQTQRRLPFEQLLLTLFLGLVVFFVILLAAGIGFQLFYLGRIMPGVSVGGIDVAGLSPSAATARLATQLTYPLSGRVLLSTPEQSWMASPSELGLFLDPEASAKAAFNVGRRGGLYQRLREQWETLQYGYSIAPELVFDERMAHEFLSGLAQQFNQPVVETSLSISGTDVVVQPGSPGRELDLPVSLAAIQAQMKTLQDGVVPLTIRTLNPVVVDAEEQADLARRILSQPLVLTMPEGQADSLGPWTFDPPTLASMLNFGLVQDGNEARYQVTINTNQLYSFLANLEPSLNLEPSNARFIFNDDTRQLDLTQPAVTGRQLEMEASIQGIQEKLVQGEHTIPLQFAFSAPEVGDTATGEELGIRELVHSETSYFYGSSADRVQNIRIGASRFHGLLVAPGETFSMAKALGDISLDNGYAEALIILGDQTIKGVGGGICQVSTTLFRAAFFSGFPIVERHAHAYRVYYYEKVAGNQVDSNLAGLDATVFVPLVDFKFTNDTPYWLLMETYVSPSNSSITWKFYSTSDGRSVDYTTTGPQNIVPAPKPLYRENPELAKDEVRQVDWEADGADVTVERTVYRDGTVYLQDTFETHYLPWQAVYEYGPGSEGYPPPEDSEGE